MVARLRLASRGAAEEVPRERSGGIANAAFEGDGVPVNVEITAEVYLGRRSLVRRAVDATGRSFIVKTAAPAYGGGAARLRHEYDVLRELHVSGAARALALEELDGTPALFLEDAGDETLASRLAERPHVSIETFFEVAIELADVLARVHAGGVVHGDLDPRNVILDDEGHVTLVDFDSATSARDEAGASSSSSRPRTLEGAAPYVSPEQTGRLDRRVDARADLYSLGAVFYEMLTGAPPFASASVAETVHAHLSRVPVSPSLVNPSVPAILTEIVLKLLAKMPEARYQSAEALASDLRVAERLLTSGRRPVGFDLGRLDRARQLVFPSTLFGRDRELAELGGALDRVRSGATELVLISGPAGTGKTALVDALHVRISEYGGHFGGGKCDLRASNVPYGAMIAAARALVQTLLAEATVASWRERVRGALGSIGAVLTEVIPGLEQLIGEQPPVPAVGPVETENRFYRAFRALIRALATSEQPLVVFLDDLQWADMGSLALFEMVATDPESRHVLVLGAFRTGTATHESPQPPLSRTLEDLAARDPRRRIALGPLDEGAVSALCCAVLRCDPDLVRPLVHLVCRKTAGNPFFVRQLLRSLQRDGLLSFDTASAAWTWDLPQIERIGVADNVVALMVSSIRKLDPGLAILPAAACIGNCVELGLLASVLVRPAIEVERALAPVLDAGLLAPSSGRCSGEPPVYRFAHDRVQQAAYSLLPDAEKQRLHLRIGRRLRQIAGARDEQALFGAVDQLNLGLEQLTDDAERIEVAKLDCDAARRARSTGAHGPALMYALRGLSLLPADVWSRHHALAFALHHAAAEHGHLVGDFALSERYLDEALRHASVLEKGELYDLRVVAQTMKGAYDDALAAGISGLALFGIEIPANVEDDAIAREQSALDLALACRSADELALGEATPSAAELLCMRLFTSLGMAVWFLRRRHFAFLALRAARFHVELGPSVQSAFAYVHYAMYLTTLGRTADGQAFGRLALTLVRRFGDRAEEGKVLHEYASAVALWSTPLRSCVTELEAALAMNLEAGNMQFAAYSRMVRVMYSLPAGAHLDPLLSECQSICALGEETGHRVLLEYPIIYRQAIRCLKGATRARGDFDDDEFEAKSFLPMIRTVTARCCYDILHLETSFVFRDFTSALHHADAAAPSTPFLGTIFTLADYHFYGALTYAALVADAAIDEPERARLLDGIRTSRDLLSSWAKDCPSSFAHKKALLDAESMRLDGQQLDAMRLYDQAIALASREGFVQDEAIACELAGRHYHALGLHRAATGYYRAACEAYGRWGATGKVRALKEEFAELRGPGAAPLAGGDSEALDIDALLEAAQTLSGEVVLDRLLEKLVLVCIEAAGAERGSLILEEEEGPFLRAEGSVTGSVVRERVALSAADLPRTIIEQVRASREVLVLADASRDARFADDAHLRSHRIRSVLVIPILRRAALVGTFYFENSLLPGAFSPARVHLLELLSAPIATSLETSLLFDKLTREIQDRKRAETTLQFLADASAALAESLDYETTLANVIRQAVPVLADWCIIDTVVGDGRLRQVAAAHVDPSREDLLRRLGERFSRSDASPVKLAIDERRPVLLSGSRDVYHAHGLDEEDATLLESLGTRSVLAVPMMARGTTAGGITLASSSRSYGPADVAIAGELARRAAVHIDNARLYRDTRQAIRSRDEFFTVTSHELSTPLTSLLLSAEALLRLSAQGRAEARVAGALLATIQRQGKQISTLLGDFRDVMQIESGSMLFRFEPTDLVEVVRSAVADLRTTLERANCSVDLEMPEHVWGIWDRATIGRVVTHLLSNAAKFGAGAAIEISVRAEASSARLTVTDHGFGIEPAQRQRVFERFVRGVSAQSYGGLGLGLYISRAIVQTHGGSIQVDSRPGAGATFTVVLPRDR